MRLYLQLLQEKKVHDSFSKDEVNILWGGDFVWICIMLIMQKHYKWKKCEGLRSLKHV